MINEEVLKTKDTIVNSVPVERLYLFGSYANGTPNENSNYDFYMVVPNDGIRPIGAILLEEWICKSRTFYTELLYSVV